MINNKDMLWAIKDVTEYLQLNEHTVYSMARKDEIPAYKILVSGDLKESLLKNDLKLKQQFYIRHLKENWHDRKWFNPA